MADRWKDAALAGLCALAVGTSAYAMWTVNRPHPSLSAGSDEATPPASTVDITPEPEDVTEEPEEETATEEPESTDEPGQGGAAADWLGALEDGDADLLAIGDGYSNLPSQWIQLWGRVVGSERPVTIHHWGEAQDVSFNEPIELSSGQGPELTIWSASRDGSSIQDAVDRLERFSSAADDPEAVLISLGQRSGNEDVAAGLDGLLAGLPEVPVLVVVGPQGLYDEGVGDAIAEWGEDNAERVVTVDLRESTSETPTVEEWAEAFQDALDG